MFALIFVSLGVLTSCDETTVTEIQPSYGINCQLGCLDIDPFPNEPGLFLGHGVTPANCLDDYTDADVDGLGDFCEEKLAAAFAPELYYMGTDDVRRESRWAARSEDDRVLIVYMLGYYRDDGAYCDTDIIGQYVGCSGHNGDSEDIALRVEYNYNTQHWVLKQADFSAHNGYNTYYQGGGYPCAYVQYPGKFCGYPRSFVAVGKHANYSNDSACDSGAFLMDECNADTSARVSAPSCANVGSRAHRFIDCVASTNTMHPNYFTNPKRQECYWTERNFQGWWDQPAGSPLVRSYSRKLFDHGF